MRQEERGKDTTGEKMVRRIDTDWSETRSPHKCTSKHKLLQLLSSIILLHAQKCLQCTKVCTNTSTETYTQMDNWRNDDSNCSLCAFGVERESEEWYCEEFQISKAIFHFPPRAGIQALTVLWEQWTSETHSSTDAAGVLLAELKTRRNTYVLYTELRQVAG